MIDIEAVKARERATTPGPWNVRKHKIIRERTMETPDYTLGGGFSVTDADFIARAREDVPALLAALEAEKARADEAEKRAEAKDVINALYSATADLDAYRFRDMSAERDIWRERAQLLQSDLINANMNLAIITERAEALERAILWNGMYCPLCVHRHDACTKARDKCPGFVFDLARFAGKGESE